MPEFVNPFSGKTSSTKLTLSELTRAIRLNISAEYEAVHLYEAHADATDNTLAKAVLHDIADEERVHAGEFQRLLNILLDDEEALLREGADEVNEMVDKLKSKNTKSKPQNEPEENQSPPTIGDLLQ